MVINLILNKISSVRHTVKFTYLRRQRQPMQMTVAHIIKAAAAIITMTTNTTKQYNKII